MSSDARLERANKRIEILEKMIEDRTRELYLEQHALTQTRDYLVRLLDAVPNALFVLSSNLRIISTNSAASRLLVLGENDFVGKPIEDFLRDPAVLSRLQGDWESTVLVHEAETVLRSSDGRRVPVLFYATLVSSDTPMQHDIVCVAVDMSEKKLLEGQLLQAQKLESIGQLAAGIAHEINTPIQFVGDNTRFLKDSFREIQSAITSLTETIQHKSPELASQCAIDTTELDFLKDEIPKAIEQTLEGVTRVSRIVRAMKEFAHPGAETKQATDVNRLIESTVIVSTNEWKYAAELTLALDKNLPLVPCHPTELNQAILNLIINAAHAIADHLQSGEKGKIVVGTSKEDDWAIIKVSDSGPGIPAEIASKIFDPFFTTKPVGKGTGQGLSMSRSIIVERHGGKIDFETTLGAGTTFSIRLPLKESKEEVVRERVEKGGLYEANNSIR